MDKLEKICREIGRLFYNYQITPSEAKQIIKAVTSAQLEKELDEELNKNIQSLTKKIY